ncbi:Na_H_Exchanger domain-containing protein [Cephalotus follicularis]|uniref:Na_H_Exchanger domain-containing protein n=1 Tax=Cephalotus follicularis TaxID=3775 RepID=A0A1Q3CBQ8_CEPFO|nr:Na_H_Exchanger domain-containing protein [Cephalotus follicularis]
MANNKLSAQEEICISLPPKVNSPGLGEYLSYPKDLLDFSMPRILLQFILIFSITHSSHYVLKRFGFPLFISQIIAGLVIHHSLHQDMRLESEESVQVLGTIGTIGYAFFLFQMGVKIDPSMVKRAGMKAFCIACLSLIMPLLCGLAAIKTLIVNRHDQITSFFTVALTCAVTSFPVINWLLSEMGILNSELGRLGQSAAIISDLSGMVLVNGSILVRAVVDFSWEQSLTYMAAIVAFLVIVVFVLRPAMSWVVRNTPEGRAVNDIYVYAVICAFLLSVSLARWFHQFVLLGPYILGLAVPVGPPLGSVLADKFDCMVSGVLLPLFVATCAMRTNLFSISNAKELFMQNAMVIIVSFVAKFGASLVPLLYSKMPKKDACALALIMCSKGIVEMASFCFLSDNRLISQDMLSLIAITVIFMATIVPILVKWLYDPSRKYAGYEKRNIMHRQPKSELQILACIHVPNNVSSVINLLEASCPTGESPIGVNVLHLIRLSGQAAPVFISHERRKNGICNYSYSENVILSFTKFEANNWGAISVNAFTAISPPSLMHEDICTLALDKLASLIILPFHCRWYIDGSIESEDHSIRTLNCMVLERAPCSVGILIDRGNKRHHISTVVSSGALYNVAVIFLGGNDDREALTYAKRMAQDTRIKLSVIRLISPSDEGCTDWVKMLDSEVLMDVKYNAFIKYTEQSVKDGPETALVVRSMVHEFDLFIVGRRYNEESPQTSGLKEWCEYPELGIIGDLFASSDLDASCSVVVVQQQQTSS